LKLDLTSEAYEQIHIKLKDVPKTAFTTIVEIFISNVLQMGDMNSPLTCQCLMMQIFCDYIGRFTHVYMDNIFIFLMSIEEHEEHLLQVFTKLREVQLYLSKKKVELYAESVECLGHLIDHKGIYTDANKMAKIHEWCRPHIYNDILRFLGLMQYLAPYMPDIIVYSMLLSSCVLLGACTLTFTILFAPLWELFPSHNLNTNGSVLPQCMLFCSFWQGYSAVLPFCDIIELPSCQ
jgi:hypothetical protein